MTVGERIDLIRLMLPDLTEDNIGKLQEGGYFTAPASTKYHGCYEGGLFDHSAKVAETLVELTICNKLKWQNPRSPWVVGMFHDICKMDCYNPSVDEENRTYSYSEDTLYKGHGDKSIILLSPFLSLTHEDIACIRYHMGAFTEKDEWKYYTRAIQKYPNVLWTHHADMIASHIKGV